MDEEAKVVALLGSWRRERRTPRSPLLSSAGAALGKAEESPQNNFQESTFEASSSDAT